MTLSRLLCPRCRLPASTCLCALVAPVSNALDVLVLQHPREARESKGSARLLALSLARCRVAVGESFDDALLQDWLYGGGHRSVLLYPQARDGSVASVEFIEPVDAPTQLVVLDATWRKSLRLLKSHPLLEALPRLALQPTHESAYAPLRKAPRAQQLSTLEAVCEALGRLEGETQRYAPLRAAFGRFVALSVARRGGALVE